MDSFVFYPTFEKAIDSLPDEMQLDVYKALVKYGIYGEEYEGDNYIVKALLESFKGSIDSAKDRRIQNAENGKKGGRPSNKPNKTEGFDIKTGGFDVKSGGFDVETEDESRFQSENLNVYVDVNDNVYVNDNVDVEDVIIARSDKITPSQPSTVITIPLNDNSEFGIQQSEIDEWSKLYPAVDVLQELKLMRGWCLGNPNKRKTKTGIKRFITNWLAKEQNSGKVTSHTVQIRKTAPPYPVRDLNGLIE